MSKTIEERERVVIRFAGDSGEGMQLAGSRFTDATAVLGNDLATLPNFPAEIRAPAGTLAGVSALQTHLASRNTLPPLRVLRRRRPTEHKMLGHCGDMTEAKPKPNPT